MFEDSFCGCSDTIRGCADVSVWALLNISGRNPPCFFYSLHHLQRCVHGQVLSPWPLPQLNRNTLRLYSNNSPSMLLCPPRYNNHPCVRPLRRGLLVATQSIDFSLLCWKPPRCIRPSASPWRQWPHNTSPIRPRLFCSELLNAPISHTHISHAGPVILTAVPRKSVCVCVCARTCAQILARVSCLYLKEALCGSFALSLTHLPLFISFF